MPSRKVIGVSVAAGSLSILYCLLQRSELLPKIRNFLLSYLRTIPQAEVNASVPETDNVQSHDAESHDPYFYQVLMFPDDRRPCKAHFWGGGCHSQRCFNSHSDNNSTLRFITHLKSAKRTLDVCVYVLTDHELAGYVINMKHKGVLVRVITNQEASNYTGTQIGKFRASGIQVRMNRDYLMHHKFLVVDREKVITGSFNWTSHATTANNENMIITNNPQIVQPYVNEFDRLWKEFDLSLGR